MRTPLEFRILARVANEMSSETVLVTADEFGDPGEVDLRCWVGGDLRQKASTRDLIWGVARLVAYASSVTTLYPGDVLLSAAPGYEFVDWGGADHLGGGSHGSLHRSDSLGVLLWSGTGPSERQPGPPRRRYCGRCAGFEL